MATNKTEITHTRGNVIVEKIKIGDVHYEYDLGMCIKTKVLTKPKLDKNGNWVWKSKNENNDNIITYSVNPKYIYYAPTLYDYEAYQINHYV